MTNPTPRNAAPLPGLLTLNQLEEAFRRLNARLRDQDTIGEVYVIGGAVMLLAFNARQATRDVDAIWNPHGIIHDEAVAVAREMGLPDYWLNEQASAFIPRNPEWGSHPALDFSHLRVFASSPHQALAMKAISARDTDREDIQFLIRHLDVHEADAVYEIINRFFPDEEIPMRTKLVMEELLSI